MASVLSMVGSDKPSEMAAAIEGLVWKYDLLAGQHTYVSPQIERILGFMPEDWLGRDWQFRLGHIHPDDRTRVTQVSGEIFFHGGQGELEYRIRTRDGSYIRLHDTIAMVGEWETARHALVVSFVVADPSPVTRSLPEFPHDQKLMFQAHKIESIGMLAGGIANDFNNILGAMLGFAELAASNESVLKDEKLASYIDEIRKGGLRGRDLVKQLLNFSHTSTAEFVRLDPVELLHDFYRFIRATVPSSYDLRLNLPQALPTIMGDASQLHQVLLNLALNARDAQNERGVITFSASEITLPLTRCASCREVFSGDFLCMSVADAGPGLIPQNINRMFQPFFTTKEVGQGSGLGLSIVHGIVHALGGHIVALASAEGGAVFHIYLPLAGPVIRVEPVAPPAEASASTGGCRVMLLDDDPAMLWLIEEMLSAIGCEVTAYSDSNAAVAAIKSWRTCPAEQRPDLVLTDLTMPFHSGIDVIRELRAVSPDCPAILMTGYSHGLDTAVLSDLAVTLMHKPIDREALTRTVNQCLAGA
jgi:PAS domain S-box-containing protein